jgi:HEPN domain-containing protein
MKQLTHEWIEKAEGDRSVASTLLNAPHPVYDAICFHSQQAAEKYLKAWLVEQQVTFPRTHDLETLARLSIPSLRRVASIMRGLRLLTSFAVEIRYPGTSATAVDAVRCDAVSRVVRRIVRSALGLPP